VFDSRKGSNEKDDSKEEVLNNNHVSKSANEAPSKQLEIPSENEHTNKVDLVDPVKLSQNESSHNSAVQLTPNSVHNNAMNASCDSSPAAMTVKDNSTVIPQKESLDQNIVQSEKVTIESKESMSVAPAIQTKPENPTSNLSQTVESVSGKFNNSAESKKTQPSQSSVGESGREPAKPAQVTQYPDQNVSPKSHNINELKNEAAQKNKKDVQPLVKPFPSQPTNTKPMEFPPKNISSPEPSSIKPPWAKSEM
jgi:hypothetical protein